MSDVLLLFREFARLDRKRRRGLSPTELRRWIRDVGRVPVQRDTLYNVLHTFEVEPDEPEPLDAAKDKAADLFGTFAEMIKIEEFHYTGQRAPSLEGPTLLEVQRRK